MISGKDRWRGKIGEEQIPTIILLLSINALIHDAM
jgi:hypothetical protein